MLYIKRQTSTLESDMSASIIPANGEIWVTERLGWVELQEGGRERLYIINMETPDEQITLGGYRTKEAATATFNAIVAAIGSGESVLVMPDVY